MNKFLSFSSMAIAAMAIVVSLWSVSESRSLKKEVIAEARVQCDNLKYPDLKADCLRGLQ